MKSVAKVPRYLTLTCAVSCAIGIFVSLYAYYVETAHELDHSYRALCDISEGISCTKVFSSRWGRGFGLMPNGSVLNQPNSVYGVAYYLTELLLLFNPVTSFSVLLELVLSITVAAGCGYLAYILFFVLQDFCVVCVSMYVVNAVILLCCVLRYRAFMTSQASSKTPRKMGSTQDEKQMKKKN